MLRGEVWQARIASGQSHVQAGNRPVVLIQNDQVTAGLPTIVAVPLTGSVAAGRFPATVLIQPDATNALTMPSVALVFQVRAFDKRDLLHRLGEVDPVTLGQIIATLNAMVS